MNRLLLCRYYDGMMTWKMQSFCHAYRSIQVMNTVFLRAMKNLVACLLCSLAVIQICAIYLILTGGLPAVSVTINVSVILMMIMICVMLVTGGDIFFKFSLALTSNSVNCWKPFWQSGKFKSRHYKAFFRSCRHISTYVGPFGPTTSRALPLLFFGQIIMATTINLLLAYR